MKKNSPESFRATARNPNSNLKPIGIYSRSDKQHHIRKQQFQEFLAQKNTIQSQPVEKKLKETCQSHKIF